jgi:hypothetical protein
MRTCKWCLWDIRLDGRGWLLAWWRSDDASAVPDPYACSGHPGHEPAPEEG